MHISMCILQLLSCDIYIFVLSTIGKPINGGSADPPLKRSAITYHRVYKGVVREVCIAVYLFYINTEDFMLRKNSQTARLPNYSLPLLCATI